MSDKCTDGSPQKMCVECPWKTNDANNKAPGWSTYILENVADGTLETPVHRCHMITNKTWDEKDGKEVNPTTDLCKGSVNACKRLIALNEQKELMVTVQGA